MTDSRETPGLTTAKALLKARKGPPDDADRPRPPSQQPKVLPGQIDIFGHVHGLPGTREEKTAA